MNYKLINFCINLLLGMIAFMVIALLLVLGATVGKWLGTI